jgi:hypothetical protein
MMVTGRKVSDPAAAAVAGVCLLARSAAAVNKDTSVAPAAAMML